MNFMTLQLHKMAQVEGTGCMTKSLPADNKKDFHYNYYPDALS
jgi:hypothetical protein